MTKDRRPTVEEIRELGARNGRALAEALASTLPAGSTQDQADGMFQIVVRGIEDTTERLIDDGVSVTLALAYRAACCEAIDQEMARHARGEGTPEGSAQRVSRDNGSAPALGGAALDLCGGPANVAAWMNSSLPSLRF